MNRTIVLLLALLAYATTLHAQAANQLPVIAGAMKVYVLVEADGTVKTWGSPHDAEGPYLGDGTDGYVAPRDEPAPLPGVEGVVDAAVGPQHVLLLKRDGTVLAWGRNNSCEVGTGDDKKRLTPTPVAGLHGVKQIGAAPFVSGAVLDDGTVWMWGSNEGGVLANGSSGHDAPCAKSPVKVEGLTGVKRIAADTSNTIALKDDGTVWGWGMNKEGQLGDGTTEKRLHPVQMKGITNAVDIANDGGNTVALLADGTIWMCGQGGEAMNQDEKANTSHTMPFKVPGVSNAVAVRSVGGATMARLRNGTLLGWGNGIFGVLGDGNGDNHRVKPRMPKGLGPVLAHYYASNSGYALKADGTVMAWGIWGGDNVGWITKPMPLFKVDIVK